MASDRGRIERALGLLGVVFAFLFVILPRRRRRRNW
jgi:hypothetical protein